jgi:hypothetical protein
VGVKGNGAVVAGATNATYDNAATAANIALDGGIATGSAAVTVNGGAGMTSATLTSTGAANSIGGLTLAAATTGLTVDAQSNVTTGNIAGAGLTTVTVKGAGSANIGNLAVGAGTVTTVNAADNAGGVTATLNGQTNFKFTGGAGNDVVTTGAVLVATASVDAGAGTADRLVVANTNHIRVDGTSKALGDLYKGFEQVQVQDGVNLKPGQPVDQQHHRHRSHQRHQRHDFGYQHLCRGRTECHDSERPGRYHHRPGRCHHHRPDRHRQGRCDHHDRPGRRPSERQPAGCQPGWRGKPGADRL